VGNPAALKQAVVRAQFKKQSSLTGLSRIDVEYAPPDLYHKIQLVSTSAQRLGSMMEQTLASNASVTRAFLTWNPGKNDVVVCASPRCGQQLILKMVKMLGALTDDDMEDVGEGDGCAVPWVECHLTDENPKVLTDPQPGGRFRVFRTAQTHAQLASKVQRSGAKFIAVLRNPMDLRRAWATYIREFYIRNGGPTAAADFDKHYKFDDFALVPITVVESSKLDKEGEYEVAMCDWLRAAEKHPSKVLAILTEEAIAKPDVVLDKINAFLGGDELTAVKREYILEQVSGVRAVEALEKGRGSMTFTPSQARMIRMKFADETDPTMLLPKMAGSFAISQQYGVFATDGDGDVYDGQQFSPKVRLYMEEVFARCVVIPFLNESAGDYKTVYSRVTGFPYPEPVVSPPPRASTLVSKVRHSVAGTLRMASSHDYSNSHDSGSVAGLAEDAQGEMTEDMDDSVSASGAKTPPLSRPVSSRSIGSQEPTSPRTPGGTRRTFVGRLLGKKKT